MSTKKCIIILDNILFFVLLEWIFAAFQWRSFRDIDWSLAVGLIVYWWHMTLEDFKGWEPDFWGRRSLCCHLRLISVADGEDSSLPGGRVAWDGRSQGLHQLVHFHILLLGHGVWTRLPWLTRMQWITQSVLRSGWVLIRVSYLFGPRMTVRIPSSGSYVFLSSLQQGIFLFSDITRPAVTGEDVPDLARKFQWIQGRGGDSHVDDGRCDQGFFSISIHDPAGNLRREAADVVLGILHVVGREVRWDAHRGVSRRQPVDGERWVCVI